MKQSLFLRNKYVVVLSFFVLVLSMTMLGCSGSTGSTGATGPAGPAGASAAATTGTVSGTVENAAGTALSGIQVNAYVSVTGGTVKAQVSASQSYQRAKNHVASSVIVAQAVTNSSGQYTLANLTPGTYDIDFYDPTGTYTIGAMDNLTLTAGQTLTINAGMGAASSTNASVSGEPSTSYPTVTVTDASNGNTVGTSSSSTTLYKGTNEVGYGNTVGLTAQATSPSNATLSYKWSASYSVNPGTGSPALSSTSGTSTTVTLPTLTQALGGVAAASSSVTGAYPYTFNGTTSYFTVSPFTPELRIGVLPITADTRGTVSTTVAVSDGNGGTTSVSVTSNAAAVQPGVRAVAIGLPVYLNSGHTGANTWTLTTPTGSKATLNAATAATTVPISATTSAAASQQFSWFVPDIAGSYTVTDSSNTATLNTVTIYAGTYLGVITGGGETTQAINATGFTPVTNTSTVVSNYMSAYEGVLLANPSSGRVSNLWAALWGTAGTTYSNWPTVSVNSLCLDCHSTGSGATITGNSSGTNITVPAPDKLTPWTYTAHATFFSRGLNNITSNSGTCLSCHTVGYDQAANAASDGGFNAIAALDGFVYAKSTDAWKTLVTTPATENLAALANIQCENCHGPQNESAHPAGLVGNNSTGVKGGTRVKYSSEDCGICHSDGTGHHIYSEWVASINPGTPGDTVTILPTPNTASYSVAVVAGSSGHGHSHMGQFDATGYTGHAQSTSTSCSRCHTAQGFASYVTQLGKYTGQSQVPSTAGALENAYVPHSVSPNTSAGNGSGSVAWTHDNAYVQTCTACHDPHNDSNPDQLRVYDYVPMTMAGVGASGLGKGAICTVCHNSRNGVQCDPAYPPQASGLCLSGAPQTGPTFNHEDTDTVAPLYNDTPHDNTQAEVLLGREAFFMGGNLPMLSKHANIQDSCVGCHMTLNPQTHISHGAAAVSDHVFYITDAERPTLCANCHSSGGDVNGLAIVTETQNGLAALSAAMGPAMYSALKASGLTTIYVGGNNTAVNGSNKAGTAISIASIGSIIFNNTAAVPANLTASGAASYYFYSGAGGTGTLLNTGGTAITGMSLDQYNTQPVVVAGIINLGPSGKFKKAVWNYQLIGKDYSNGIHNPGFVSSVLANTLAAIQNTSVQ